MCGATCDFQKCVEFFRLHSFLFARPSVLQITGNTYLVGFTPNCKACHGPIHRQFRTIVFLQHILVHVRLFVIGVRYSILPRTRVCPVDLHTGEVGCPGARPGLRRGGRGLLNLHAEHSRFRRGRVQDPRFEQRALCGRLLTVESVVRVRGFRIAHSLWRAIPECCTSCQCNRWPPSPGLRRSDCGGSSAVRMIRGYCGGLLPSA